MVQFYKVAASDIFRPVLCYQYNYMIATVGGEFAPCDKMIQLLRVFVCARNCGATDFSFVETISGSVVSNTCMVRIIEQGSKSTENFIIDQVQWMIEHVWPNFKFTYK